MSVLETAPHSASRPATARAAEGADEAHAPHREHRINWVKSIPFFFVHVAALSIFFVPFAWKWVALAVGLYLVKMFGITAGYHRYFSHRSYRVGRGFQFVLALTGILSLQKGPLWWAAHHRHHHATSDGPEDLHSPHQDGFWWSHVGWILSNEHHRTEIERVPDLARFPELRWLDRHYIVPGVLLAVALFLLGGWSALAWGFFFSTVLTWHCTFFINSLAHVFGRRRYPTTDDSRNSLLLALLTLGEGWHNNHHHYMASARQGFFWWEVDISYYVLKAFSKVGLVWDLRQPPKRLLDREAIRAAAPEGKAPRVEKAQQARKARKAGKALDKAA